MTVDRWDNIESTARTEAALATPLLDPIDLVTGGVATKIGYLARREIQPIAVGLSRSGTHKPGLLVRFADRVGATTY